MKKSTIWSPDIISHRNMTRRNNIAEFFSLNSFLSTPFNSFGTVDQDWLIYSGLNSGLGWEHVEFLMYISSLNEVWIRTGGGVRIPELFSGVKRPKGEKSGEAEPTNPELRGGTRVRFSEEGLLRSMVLYYRVNVFSR